MKPKTILPTAFLAICLFAFLDSQVTVKTSNHIYTMNPFTILGWGILAIIILGLVISVSKFILGFVAVLHQARAAARWRKKAKVGDEAKFINAHGTWTRGRISSFHDVGGAQHAYLSYRTSCSSGSTLIALSSLFPSL